MISRICFVIFAIVDIKKIRSRLVSEPTKLYVVGNGSWSEGYTKSEIWNDQLVRELPKTATGQVKSQLDSIHCEFLEYWNTQKLFGGFDNIFHVYLMRRFQKYGRHWILTVAFLGPTKAVQKCAPRWAEFAVLFCR